MPQLLRPSVCPAERYELLAIARSIGHQTVFATVQANAARPWKTASTPTQACDVDQAGLPASKPKGAVDLTSDSDDQKRLGNMRGTERGQSVTHKVAEAQLASLDLDRENYHRGKVALSIQDHTWTTHLAYRTRCWWTSRRW